MSDEREREGEATLLHMHEQRMEEVRAWCVCACVCSAEMQKPERAHTHTHRGCNAGPCGRCAEEKKGISLRSVEGVSAATLHLPICPFTPSVTSESNSS